MSYDELIPRAVPRRVQGGLIHVTALDDIGESKELANRDKDGEALPKLRRLEQRQPR